MLYIVYNHPELFFCGQDIDLAEKIAKREGLLPRRFDDFLKAHPSDVVCQVIEEIIMDKKGNLDSCREQIQNDLLCLLDNESESIQESACEIVVSNFAKL